MDNADLRRGNPTLHKTYDEVTAILVGDALNTHSFNLLANASLSSDVKIELIKILSCDGGIDGMIIGQAIDCYFENQKISLDKLEFLHIHKTAKLIAASLKMGAIVANLSYEVQSEDEAGKTTSNDTNKNSFVNLLGLESAIDSANKLSKKCEDDLNSFDERIKNNLSELLSKYLNRHII